MNLLRLNGNIASLTGGLLPGEGAAVYCLKRTGNGVIDGGDYLWKVFFNDGQLNCRQRNNCETSPGEGLLMVERLIRGKEDLNPVVLSCP